jgi:hypothetical protein
MSPNIKIVSKHTEFQESVIDEEPILGTVLRMADGRIQTLTPFEQLLVTLRLINARQLEARHARAAKA